MADKRTSMEVIAASVEEAIESGLAGMGLSIDDVDIEYIDEGSKGLFGLGGRQAKIRITRKGAQPMIEAVVEPISPVVKRKPKESAEPVVPKPAKVKPVITEVSPVNKDVKLINNGVEDPVLKTARETVSELLEKMHIHAQVTSTFTESSDDKDQPGILVEVTGEDLSILIGRKTETLNALQYISSLIIGKRLEMWMPLVIDVEGYRARRERQLTQLALRMAEQAIATGRRQTLEPMPANERRIIHLALRDHPQVFTESTGEEPFRKLTIIPRK